MRVWLDNTGLHGAGRCLHEAAESELDLRAFLNLAVLVAFSDELRFNPFEPEHVASRTQEYVEGFRSIGVDDTVLRSSDVNEASYALACQTAGEDAAEALPDVWLPGHHDSAGLAPELPRGDSLQADLAHLSVQDLSVEDLDGVREGALEGKAEGAVRYMLASSSELRSVVASMMSQSGDWTDAHAHQLGAFLRYYLNDALAAQNHSTYAPAVGRAMLIRKTNLFLLERLSHVVDGLAAELCEVALPLTAVHEALILRGKGEPRAILEQAVQLRDRTAYIRKWLRASIERRDTDAGAFYAAAHAETKDVESSIAESLHEKPSPKPAVAIKWELFTGTPCISVDIASLQEWYEHWRRRRRFAVLTEMCAQAMHDPDRHVLTRRFRRMSIGS